jgi:transposase
MNSLPDLDRLGVAEKDALIRAQFAQIQVLTAEVAALTAKVAELEGRLALNSRNSSKPPSAGGYGKPKPKSLRRPGENPRGGQQGHEGHTLKGAESPDHIVLHAPPATCDACGLPLPEARVAETRQVFDLPPTHYEVTEHRVLEARCACGKWHRGEFPEGVNAPVQYGPRLKGAGVHLTQHHMLPAQRTAELMGDLFDLPLSDATVLAAVEEACERLESTVTAIGQAISAAPIAHADETGMRVAGKLHWLHVLATTYLTWMGIHPNRGKKAFDAFGLLSAFVGTLVHDGWKPYRDLACHHALCNAHHLRELTYIFDGTVLGQPADRDATGRLPGGGKGRRPAAPRSHRLLPLPSTWRSSPRARPPIHARRLRASAAARARARPSICSTGCAPTPTMCCAS